MDINDLLKDAKNIPSYQLERRLNKLVYENHNFRNLGAENKKLLMDIIKEYIQKIKRGQTISSETIRRDTHHLYEDRIKLNLTKKDLEDFREILGLLKNS